MDDSPPASRPSPSGRHAAEDDPSGGVSRRWFLTGSGVVVVVAAATGYVVRIEREPAAPVPTAPPTLLVRAAERERALIADLDATSGGSAELRQTLTRARSDHAAHLAAFEDLLARYEAPTPSASSSSSSSSTPAHGTPRTSGQLQAAERAAAAAAAHDADASSGKLAVLLASVSASEATHAAVIQ